MSIRDKCFAAMRRQAESYVPFEFGLCPALHDEFRQRVGQESYADYYGFPVRGISVDYCGAPDKFVSYYPDDAAITIDPDWGVGHKQGSMAHFTEMQSPMKNFQTLAEFEAYPYPHPVKDYAWDAFPTKVKAVQGQDLVAIASMQMTIFEIAWYLRGMETFLGISKILTNQRDMVN